jgi:SSS family solute:Na+ symporter
MVYLIGTVGLGLWVGRRMRAGSDFFLAGRSLPWWAVGMSLVATDIGGVDIVGVGGSAYTHGMAVANFEWIGCVPAMIVAAFLFVPHFWRCGITTIPEFMERRFNVGVRTALALCWLVFMACNLGVMLFVSAKMMGVLLGWGLPASIFVTAILVGVYTSAGGLAAVVYTDVVQGVVMIGGCLMVLVIGLVEIGGIDELQSRLQAVEQQRAAVDAPADDSSGRPERLSLILPVDTKTPFPWTGILFGLAMILSPAYWIGNQAIIQRSLGARSAFDAKASYVWGALLKNLIPLIIAVPGLIAVVRFPELASGDDAFPMLVGALLPSGARGVFAAAFLAALMSSVDSYLNAASTILTNDLYQRFARPQASGVELLWVGRITTVALVAWAIFFAFVVARLDAGVYAIFQTMMAIFQGPALATLMAGLLWKRATGPAALAGFVTGVATAIFLYLTTWPAVLDWLGWKPLFRISDPFLYLSVWAFLVSLAVIVPLSLITRREPLEKLRYAISLRRAREENA